MSSTLVALQEKQYNVNVLKVYVETLKSIIDWTTTRLWRMYGEKMWNAFLDALGEQETYLFYS